MRLDLFRQTCKQLTEEMYLFFVLENDRKTGYRKIFMFLSPVYEMK